VNTTEKQPPAILVVAPDQELQTILREVLTEEGYVVVAVASLEEASQQIDERAFALILADLFVGPSKHAFTPAHLLRRRAWPTPMGLLSAVPSLSPEAAHAAGFACMISMPFELSEFLAVVAAVLHQPLTPEQERQAEVVQRFLDALSAEDWEVVGELCTPDVLYHPPRASIVTSSVRVYGRDALRAHGQAAAKHYMLVFFNALSVYARPHGLAARYTGHWTTPQGERLRLAGTMLFHFSVDNRIRQIGVHTPLIHKIPRNLSGFAG